MNFREATDSLFDRVDHEQLASRLGVSVASIRQARLRPDAGAHRAPPEHWRTTVLRLAEERVHHYSDLIAELQNDYPDEAGRKRGRTRQKSAAAPTQKGAAARKIKKIEPNRPLRPRI